MGQTIHSVTDMVSYAGDLRRHAAHQSEKSPEAAQKIQQAADNLEQTAFARLSLTDSNIGRLLDTLA